MDQLIAFLQENASWLFGSGGAVALILAAVRRKKPAAGDAAKSSGVKPGQVISIRGNEGEVVGGNKTTTTTNNNGFSASGFALAVALVVAIVGAVFLLIPAGNVVTAGDCSAVTQGDGNTTTVISQGNCN